MIFPDQFIDCMRDTQYVDGGITDSWNSFMDNPLFLQLLLQDAALGGNNHSLSRQTLQSIRKIDDMPLGPAKIKAFKDHEYSIFHRLGPRSRR